jgi:inositol-phosphate phosphatase / L-galactose 1-phosphate phosphatase / histidinol-phosphatase
MASALIRNEHCNPFLSGSDESIVARRRVAPRLRRSRRSSRSRSSHRGSTDDYDLDDFRGRSVTDEQKKDEQYYQKVFKPFAEELCDRANEETMKFWRKRNWELPVEIKDDRSPVTVADKQAELRMRELVRERFPEHAIFGEEHGIELGLNGAKEFLWVFDPIDGTKSYITGKPLWGTLIALLRNGEPILGVLEQPVLKERWIGCKGAKTTFNGKICEVNKDEQKELKEAFMYSTTPLMFLGENERRFEKIKNAVKIPMFGCDCYAYGLLANGFCDIVCEADLKPYDYMALVPIVLGAGGYMTDWEGQKLEFKNADDEDAIELKRYQGEVLACASERMWRDSIESLKK